MTRTICGRTASACACVLALLLSACNSMPARDPAYAGVRPPTPVSASEVTGGIYHASSSIVLYEDQRARRVGDILIIKLVESTNAVKSAGTTTKKENDVAIANPNLFGTTVQWDASSRLPLASTTGLNLSANLNSSQNFKGDAGSSQKNSQRGYERP